MDVDPEGEFPFLVRDILDRFEGRLVRRVVDENVDAAKLCDRLVDDRAAMRGRSDIARDQDRLASPSSTSRCVSFASSCSLR
jgi:hypothetical protein